MWFVYPYYHDPGTGNLRWRQADGTLVADFDGTALASGHPVSCVNPEDTRANDRIEYEILTVSFTTAGVLSNVNLVRPGYAYADGAV